MGGGNPVVGDKEVTTGRGGKNTHKETRMNIVSREENDKKTINEYPEDLGSRFGEAFLPFASKLESVEKNRIERKRRGKHARKQPTKITRFPSYLQEDERRREYDEKRDSNMDKISKKIQQIQIDERSIEEKLKWKGDVMTFNEGWPNTDQRKTMRIFNINLNGITYQNEYLEWEMTVAFLMDMQVDVFGLTEINLDLNNGIVKDKFIQAAKHFDPYLRITTSSSSQKVGNSPFKMGGTVTGTNGCWSGRICRQGCDNLGRWSFMTLQARHGHQVVFITTYIPGKPSSEGGGTTIHSQMEADLLKKTGK